MNRLLARFARRLWPFLRPFVLDLLTAQADRQAAPPAPIAARANERMRRYIGE